MYLNDVNRSWGNRWGYVACLVVALTWFPFAMTNGNAGSPESGVIQGSGAINRTEEEPITFMLRGSLISMEGGLYGIRDSEGVETTVLSKSGTTMVGVPKVGDQVEVEYLENGTALLIMVLTSTPRPGQIPEKK